jgi:hypothetical protein
MRFLVIVVGMLVFPGGGAAGFERAEYADVPCNHVTHTLELQDVGLTCLVINESEALAEIADLLDRHDRTQELRDRAKLLRSGMESLAIGN